MSSLESFPWFSAAANPRKRARALAHQDHLLLIDLVKIRLERGLSQAQVAEMLGVTQQAISKLERPGSDPRLSRLRQYAHAIGALIGHDVALDNGELKDGEWECIGFIRRSQAKPAGNRYISVAANAHRFGFGLAA
jgi:transcriptional regulator with XRE-family HTH domain